MSQIPSRKTFVVHHIDHANRVLAVAAELSVPVTLLSSAHGASTLGPAVFREMMSIAASKNPTAEFTAVLDCGCDAGLALNAIRQKVPCISVQLADEALSKVRQIANKCGTELIDRKTIARNYINWESPQPNLLGMDDDEVEMTVRTCLLEK